MMPTLLVLGRNGQLGWELARRAPCAGLRVRALGREELDISDRAAVLNIVNRLSPAVIVNAAAYTAVDRAEEEPAAAIAVNRDGAANLAEACERNSIPLIHLSTDYVYDGSKGQPYVEDDPVAPLGVYGWSKLTGEDAIRRTCSRHVILRTAWVYGVHGRNFVKTMLRLGRKRDRLQVVADQHGSPTFAGDLADAALAIAAALTQDKTRQEQMGTFHCAGEKNTSWYSFAREIFAVAEPLLGRAPTIEPIASACYPTAAKRPLNSVLDCSRLAKVHRIRLRPWRAALADVIEAVAAEVLSEER